MRVISIIGARGFIGGHLLSLIGNYDDIEIRVLSKNKKDSQSKQENVRICHGDLLMPDTLHRFLERNCTVINLAYLADQTKEKNIKAISNLAKVCEDVGIRRLIHLSTAVVADRVQDNIVDEKTICKPSSEYEMTKVAIEKLLIDNYSKLFEVLILRPTAVFGPEGKNLLKLANDLVYGNRIINYFKSCLFNFRRINLVCVENVVAAINFLIHYEKKNKEPETFIVSDDEDRSNSYRAVELSLMRSFEYSDYVLPILPVPLFVLGFLLKFTGKTNYRPSSVYSCQKLLNAGFEKPASLPDSLDHFAEWYKLNFVNKQESHN